MRRGLHLVPDPIGHIGGGSGFSAVSGGGDNIVYTIRDDFTAAVAAGALNGTAATPGPGTRVAVDTAGTKMSITASGLTFSGGAAGGNPGVWYDAITRKAGGILTFRVTQPSNYNLQIGFDLDQAGNPGVDAIYLAGTTISFANNSSVIATIGSLTYLTPYDFTIILRATGAEYYVKGGTEYPVTTLLWISRQLSTATLYPCIANTSSSAIVSYIRYLDTSSVVAVPIVSDAFASWDIGKWTAQQGTWGVTSGAAKATGLDGGGVAIATASASTGNVMYNLTLTRSAGTTGVVVHYVDSDNYVYAGHDGTNAYLVKRVGGVETTVLTAAKAFGNGECTVIWDNGKVEMYWAINNRIGTGGVIADAVLQSSRLFGLFTTNTGNTHDNVAIYDRGT